ncbi:M15 family metallopeptidase [Cellulomonas sp. ACRRI]|uniref:M15 family metallopeptidase n=1 Tax=Cellulomonas sp. ACRRI TaxID=2918188 RepID=UPI001EF2E054|nr:M15 family metallopeptidase [Cellulomonas sp. ACRRI]MCG7287916.1 M15 family metallopeptidase [Cellulomonas sp. ACRRI]
MAPEATAPGYAGTVGPITPELAARMSSSWRAGCPVPLTDLRYVTVTYRDVDGGAATGELVVHADVADSVVAVFGELFALGYPIRSMRLVDDFGGSDDASMAADNTSAFNCRPISRGTGWSEHAYGRAIDLNPVENPYVRGSLVLPPEGVPFADRPDAPGVLHAGDPVVRAFAAHGWRWGGDWASPVDYQHFSTTGR